MSISIIDKEGFLDSVVRKKLRKSVSKIIKYLELPKQSELCISIVNDEKIRELNKNYRNINRATDILSFTQEIGLDNNLLGDLVISYQTALRHSKKYNVTIEREFNKLLIHGILHLIGYDHKKKKETGIMREKEKELEEFISR